MGAYSVMGAYTVDRTNMEAMYYIGNVGLSFDGATSGHQLSFENHDWVVPGVAQKKKKMFHLECDTTMMCIRRPYIGIFLV